MACSCIVRVFGREECFQYRCVADEEGSLVQLLSTEPRSDLAIVFARVARRTGRNHVLQGVAATARDRHDAIALHGDVRCLAVCATSPRASNASPLLGGEVIVYACQPLLSALRIPRASRRGSRRSRELPTGRHMVTVLRESPQQIDTAARRALVVHVPGIGPHALIDCGRVITDDHSPRSILDRAKNRVRRCFARHRLILGKETAKCAFPSARRRRHARSHRPRQDEHCGKVRRVPLEVDNQRLGEPAHCELRRRVGRVRGARAETRPDRVDRRRVHDRTLIGGEQHRQEFSCAVIGTRP
jgi:hypothetical protein